MGCGLSKANVLEAVQGVLRVLFCLSLWQEIQVLYYMRVFFRWGIGDWASLSLCGVKVSTVLLSFPVLKSISVQWGNYVLAWISTYTALLAGSLWGWALCSSVWHFFLFSPADWDVGWAGFQHPRRSSCTLWCSSYSEPELTNKRASNSMHDAPCCSFMILLKYHWIKLSVPFFSLFLALSRVPAPLRQLKMKRTSARWQSTPLTWERRSRSWMNYGGTLLTWWAPSLV